MSLSLENFAPHREDEHLLAAGGMPMSYGQQRLWFLDQLNPGNPAYNISSAFRLHGDLDVAQLEWSLNEVISRHEILRTHFVFVDGQPQQVVRPTIELTVQMIEVAASSQQEREHAAEQSVNQEVRRSFDLSTGPLFRAMLVRLGREDHVLLITMHHIVSDGWSMSILVKELAAFYEESSGGRPAALLELKDKYAVIKVQIPTGLMLLLANITIMYLFAFKRA